jgi:hypothetical protein
MTNELLYGISMFLLGWIAGTVFAFRRLDKLVDRMNEEFKNTDIEAKVKIDWKYTLSVMLLGVPRD